METRSRRKSTSRSIVRSSTEDQADSDANINNSKAQDVDILASLPDSSTFVTPLRTPGLQHLRQKIEEELGRKSASRTVLKITSPGLARLRSTPGQALKEKQKNLVNRHEQIRQNSDKLNIGGGITLWPNMNQMRLSHKEIILLIFMCFILMTLTGWLFMFLHGETFQTMWNLTTVLKAFEETHPIMGTGSKFQIKGSILTWHSDHKQLLNVVDRTLNVKRPPVGYQLYILTYLLALGMLVYFLAHSMFSKSRLSPSRIKKWVCLLIVVTQWTVLLFAMFISAHKLEAAFVENVHQISEKVAPGWRDLLKFGSLTTLNMLGKLFVIVEMGLFVEYDLDLNTLSYVVQYWRGRCLPPSAPGIIHVLGLVPVQDLATYLQYYSLPVLTVLLMPVVRLCLALRTIYAPAEKS